jgi:hypothetical protein
MLNKIKKTIANAKFKRAQDKRFASVLDQDFDLEDNSAILRTSILVGIIAAACFWAVVIGLDAQAGKLDQKIENEQFQRNIKLNHNQ